MRELFKRFIHEEDGSELIQFAIIIAIAAVLAGVALGISQSAGDKMQQAADMIDRIDIPTTGSGGGNGPSA